MKPLLDETKDELERAVLREAKSYVASPRARALAIAALDPTKPVPWKGIGLKIVAGVAVVGAAAALLWPRPTPPKEDASPVQVTVKVERASEPANPVPQRAEPELLAPPAPTPKVISTPLAITTSKPSPPAPSAGLGDEILVIDRARKAVYASDKAGAIRALDEYDSRFPQGALAPEARTLRAKAHDLP